MDIRKSALEDPVSTAWAGRRVLITGHTGFKGGWLALWLSTLDAHVRGFALAPPTEPSLFESIRLHDVIEDVRGDVTDGSALAQTLQDFQPEVIFHLAAQSLVRPSYADPSTTYATNVIGTLNLLEAVRKTSSVRAVIVVTSDKCYRNNEDSRAYGETDPLGGHDPYSSSKACVEILAASYRDSFFSASTFSDHGVAVATARAGNVIGGGDWSQDRLVPDLVRGFLNHLPVPVRYPEAVRPWQHVLEPLAGYLKLAQKLVTGEPNFADAWNFGPPDENMWTVGQIATALQQAWGHQTTWIHYQTSSPHEAGTLRLDSSKARRELGWVSRLDIPQTLDWIANWYRAWHAREDMRAFTLEQIRAYEALGPASSAA